MNSKHLRDQDITLNKDGAAGEKTEIVYSCAGPRVAPEEELKENSLVKNLILYDQIKFYLRAMRK